MTEKTKKQKTDVLGDSLDLSCSTYQVVYPAGMLLLLFCVSLCFHIIIVPENPVVSAANHPQQVGTGRLGHGCSADPTPYIVLLLRASR